MGNTSSNTEEVYGNPLTHIQLLNGHSTRIRCMIKMNDYLLASGDDNGKIIIWNTLSGSIKYCFNDHKLPVICLLPIIIKTQIYLISGSSDKTLKIWNINSGLLLHTLQGHNGSITCIIPLRNNPTKICSAGNDSHILIWDIISGKNIGSITRNEEENLYCMLSLKNNLLITGSNSPILYVYDTEKLCFKQLLAITHEKAVTCLVEINDSLFASASADGSIVVYDTNTLSFSSQLQEATTSNKKNTKISPSKIMVNHLSLIGQNFLASAVGTGFKVYHIHSGNCVFDCLNGHDGIVSDLIPLYDTSRIITCSLDGHIRIWGSSSSIDMPSVFKKSASEKSSIQQREALLVRRDPTEPLHATLLADMCVHSEAITNLVAISQYEFASCGNDGIIILWKDGRIETELRNCGAWNNFVIHNVPGFENNIRDTINTEEDDNELDNIEDGNIDNIDEKPENLYKPKAKDLDLENYSESQKELIKHIIDMKQITATNKESFGVPIGQGKSFGIPPGDPMNYTIPRHTFDYAQMLHYEKKKNIPEVCSILLEQGYSEIFVRVTRKKL